MLYGVKPDPQPEPQEDNMLLRNLAHTPMRLVDMDDPPFLRPDWVVTKPRLTGICGSDSKQVFMDWGNEVGNPDNPRPEDDYSDSDPEFRELKASMKEIGQLQPLAVVSRETFERAKPEAVAAASSKIRKLIRDADWVVVTGNRRLAAARQLGWTRIDIRVQDHLGDEDGRLDEAVAVRRHGTEVERVAAVPVGAARRRAVEPGNVAGHGAVAGDR